MYHFQIGLDLGSLYSKCVYRDLCNNPDKPYVFYFKTEQNYNILIPSYIIFKDNKFIFNAPINLYPEYGLWDIKYAVASLYDAENRSSYLSQFSNITKLQLFSEELKNFVQSSFIFLTSRIFNYIRKGILENFPDFGKDNNDIMNVNISLPTKYFINDDIKQLFCDLLDKSWKLASNKSLLPFSSLEEILEVLKTTSNINNKLCRIYPETSASFFALNKITNINYKNIFLHTNTDIFCSSQSLFRYDDIKNSIDYITAFIFQTEQNSISNMDLYIYLYENELIYKEYKDIDDEDIINYLHNIERNTYNKTKDNTLLSFINKEKGNNYTAFVKDIFENFSLIFSGDPYINNFSQKGIFRALDIYSTILKKINWNNRIIYFNKHIKLSFYPKIIYLLQYFDIAYGLSYSYKELPNNTFSNTIILKNKILKQVTNAIYDITTSDTQIITYKIKKKKKIKKIINIRRDLNKNTCPFCLGKNPHCIHCGGF